MDWHGSVWGGKGSDHKLSIGAPAGSEGAVEAVRDEALLVVGEHGAALAHRPVEIREVQVGPKPLGGRRWKTSPPPLLQPPYLSRSGPKPPGGRLW